jgi:hypothetical protein
MDEDLIKAAMIEDDEDRRLKEEKSTEDESTDDQATTDDQSTDDEETEDTSEGDVTEDESEEKSDESETSDDDKPTRKERREERRQRWLESVRKDAEQRQPQSQEQQQQPQHNQPDEYNPLDYSKLDEIDEDQLVKDRQSYAERERNKGAQEAAERERFIAEQNDFWKDVQHEATLLNYDPKFAFLDENKPDTFDPDLAADLNEKYLEFVGYDQKSNTVLRTNISYEKFLRKEMAEREAWAERQAADEQQTVQQTRATTSVRPGGTRKSGLGKLKPGDISKMSKEDFEKYEAEIDKQIAAELGIS